MYMYGIDYKMYGYIREVLRPQHALEDICNKIHIFQCMDKIFCVEFEILHKISYTYIKRHDYL